MPRFKAGNPIKPNHLAATRQSTTLRKAIPLQSTMSKQSIKIDLTSNMDHPVFDGLNSPINIISLSSHAAT